MRVFKLLGLSHRSIKSVFPAISSLHGSQDTPKLPLTNNKENSTSQSSQSPGKAAEENYDYRPGNPSHLAKYVRSLCSFDKTAYTKSYRLANSHGIPAKLRRKSLYGQNFSLTGPSRFVSFDEKLYTTWRSR